MPKYIFLCIGLALSQTVWSLPSDETKLIELSADSADLNQKTHSGNYSGNVTYDQGTTHLRADRAVTNGNEKNKLIETIAMGSLTEQAHFWTQLSINKPIMHAYANTIKYYPDKHLIELIGNAKVTQGKNSFQASKISYDIVKQQVLSNGDEKKQISIVIHPEKKA
jgi:lipopolysaccharide export system protein LptA